MEKFCNGIIWGMLAGAAITAVSIANNKKLYNVVREKTDIVKKKISSYAGKIKEKLDKNSEKQYDCQCKEELEHKTES